MCSCVLVHRVWADGDKQGENHREAGGPTNFCLFSFLCVASLGERGTRLMLLVFWWRFLCSRAKKQSKRVVYTLGSKQKRVKTRFSTERVKQKKSKAVVVNTKKSKQKRGNAVVFNTQSKE